MPDKVMSPPKTPRQRPGIVQAKSSIIEGPTQSVGDLNPFNRTDPKSQKTSGRLGQS